MRLRGFFAPRALVPVLALLQCLVGTTSAQTSADLDAALNHKQDAVEQLKLSLETAARDINAGTFDNSTCEIYSSCSAELKDPYCHFNYGNSKGCGCDKGRTIDTKNSVIKTSPKLGANDYSVKRTACQAKYVDSTLRGLYDSMIEKGDAKWLFYGCRPRLPQLSRHRLGRKSRRQPVRRFVRRAHPPLAHDRRDGAQEHHIDP